MNRTWAGWVGLGLLTAALAVAGYWVLFSTFMSYDDEGYVLMSLRNYGTHGALYDLVYTQYGPFFYLLFDALHHALGFAWDHTTSRWLTLGIWLAIAITAAAITQTVSGRRPATALTLAGVFTMLWVMSREPMHPGGLAALLGAVAAWWGVQRDPSRNIAAATGLGALGAALLFTKINTGIFLLGAGAAWLACNAPASRGWRALSIAAVSALGLLPIGLMQSLRGQTWVQEFVAVAALANLSLGLVILRSRSGTTTARHLAGFAAGAGSVGTLAVVGVLASGSSLADVWLGVLVAPLRHPGVYFFAFNWRPGTLAVALASAAAVAWILARPEDATARALIIVLRVAGALTLTISALGWWSLSVAAFCLTYGLPLAAVCAVPLTIDEAARRVARQRTWLALVFALQCLHAYPVAGSQLNWGGFLGVPLLVLANVEVYDRLAPALWLRRTTVAAGWILAIAITGLLGRVGWNNIHTGEPLNLPGAEHIVLPDDVTFGLRVASTNARHHADMLFSLPGSFSLNFWTGLPTPTLANTTHWFSLLSEERQRAIIAALDADPRAAVMLQLGQVSFLLRNGFEPKGPLLDYIMSHFVATLEVDGFALYLKPGRTIAALNTARWVPRTEGGEFQVVLTGLAGPINEVRFSGLTGRERLSLGSIRPGDEGFQLTPLLATGEPAGPPQTLAWGEEPPAALQAHFVRLTIPAPLRPPVESVRLLLELLDADGRRLDFARVLP